MVATAFFAVLRIVSFMTAKTRQVFQTVESGLWAKYRGTAHNPVPAGRNGTGPVILGKSFFQENDNNPEKVKRPAVAGGPRSFGFGPKS